MKLRLPFIIIFIAVMAALWGIEACHADDLQWQIPGGVGTVQLPTDPTAVLPVLGYDAIKKQVIAGGATSLFTLWHEIDGYVGAVGEWNTQAANVQPYLSIGTDFARYVPALRQVQNLQIQGFVRYVASSDKHLGAGVAVAYKFGPVAPVIPQAPSQPPAPPATLPPAPVAGQ